AGVANVGLDHLAPEPLEPPALRIARQDQPAHLPSGARQPSDETEPHATGGARDENGSRPLGALAHATLLPRAERSPTCPSRLVSNCRPTARATRTPR